MGLGEWWHVKNVPKVECHWVRDNSTFKCKCEKCFQKKKVKSEKLKAKTEILSQRQNKSDSIDVVSENMSTEERYKY